MSLATFKKKSIHSASSATKRSGKPTDDYWLYAGPYGSPDTLASTIFERSLTAPNGSRYGMQHARNAGFSINGVYRKNKDGGLSTRKFSSVSTPFRGAYPMGNGGKGGRYPSGPNNVVLKSMPVLAEVATYTNVVKPSVLSNRGMLQRRFRWAHSGQYPTYWVQPVYTGNQTETVSQGMYIHQKSVANDIWYDVNDTALYEDYRKTCGATGCNSTPARGYTMGIQQANAAYTKTLHIPKDASAYTLHIQRRCANPLPWQKPFPYAVQTGTGVLRGGTSVSHVASACNASPVYTSPPEWYTSTASPTQIDGSTPDVKLTHRC